MKAGVIGLLSSDLERLRSFSSTWTENGVELETRLEVTGVKQTPDGLEITQGRAAAEQLSEERSVQIDDEISVVETEQVETQYTEFALVDGEFLVVQSSRGAFLFDLLEREYGVGVTRAHIDLDSFLTRFDNATPWKVGFYGHGDDAENGVIHGESVLSDGEFGRALRSSRKNQLGLKLPRNGSTLKLTATESGYVEIYQPSNYTENQFCDFLRSDIIPVTSPPE